MKSKLVIEKHLETPDEAHIRLEKLNRAIEKNIKNKEIPWQKTVSTEF
jgi:hypothetical protein